MLKEVNKHQWKEEKLDDLGVFFNTAYLEGIEKSFSCIVKFYLDKSNDVLNCAIVLFSKGNRVYLPENFTYTPVWFKPDISERKQIEIFSALITQLKNQFYKITLKLNVDIKDVRAFKWDGFNVETRYTYIRDRETKIHKTIETRLKKIPTNEFILNIEKPNLEDILLNVEFLKEIGFRKSLRKKYIELLKLWNDSGFLKSFRICDDKSISLGCFIVLLDENSKKAYTLMINGANRNHEFIHAMVYHEITKWLDQNDYKEVDFCGANYKGIAQFKSFFNPKLMSYHIVNYSPFLKYFNPILRLINHL